MLTQHRFYVYYEENRVMARMDDKPPVVAKVCQPGKDAAGNPITGAQVAHDLVQTIINPKGLKHDHPSLQPPTPEHPDPKMRLAEGFHHPAFQEAISGNCEAFVKAAYAAGKK